MTVDILRPSGVQHKKTERVNPIKQLEDQALQGSLSEQDLLLVADLVLDLRDLKRPWKDSGISRATGIIRNYFGSKFSLCVPSVDADVLYARIYARTIPTAYFNDRPSTDPELVAMTLLMSYHDGINGKS